MTSYLSICCCDDDSDDGGGDGGDGIPGCCDSNPSTVTLNVNATAEASGSVIHYKQNPNWNGNSGVGGGSPYNQSTNVTQNTSLTGTVTWDLSSGDPPVSNVICRASHVCRCQFSAPGAESTNGGQGCSLSFEGDAAGTYPVDVGISIRDFKQQPPGSGFDIYCSEIEEEDLEGCAFVVSFSSQGGPGIFGEFRVETDCKTYLNHYEDAGEWNGQVLPLQRQMIFLINRTQDGSCEVGDLVANFDPRAFGSSITGGPLGNAIAAYGFDYYFSGGCQRRPLRGEEVERWINAYGFDPTFETSENIWPCYNGETYSTGMTRIDTNPVTDVSIGFIASGTLSGSNSTTLEWE